MTPYLLKEETIRIDDIDYLIHSLKNRQQFDDQNGDAEAIGISSATWSLFGIVWPASKVLATVVCAIDLEGKRVLEIGCGIGLSSIVLHKMGIDITASDYHPLAKEFIDNNILINEMLPIKFETGNWETMNPLLGEFDLIIGSDVLYEPLHAEQVSQFINRHAKKTAKVIIVDPNRSNRSNFTKKMISLGYTHHFEAFNIDNTEHDNCKGRILHYQR